MSSILHGALDKIHASMSSALESIPDTFVLDTDIILNAVTVETTTSRIDEIARIRGVISIEEAVFPESLLDNTAQGLKLKPGTYPNVVWDEGYTGQNFDAMILDTGVNTSHSAFVGLDLISQFFPTNATGCTYQDSSNHGTHTAGVIASQDSTYPGLSFGIETLYNAKLCSG
ncbi:MAG TPA: hypothetical protein ENN67_05030, partial [Firmicutes bacterium]|nr:hypothetical protein [Bacillota bacterium]